MPSEKSRYLERNRGPSSPISWHEIGKSLESHSVSRLAATLVAAAERHEPLRKVVVLQATFATHGDDMPKLKQGIDYAMHISGHIPYDRSDDYALVLHQLHDLLEDAARQGRGALAAVLAEHAVSHLEAMGEHLQDAHGWEMAAEDLEVLSSKLRDGAEQDT